MGVGVERSSGNDMDDDDEFYDGAQGSYDIWAYV